MSGTTGLPFKAWLHGSEPRQYLNDDEVTQLGVKYWEIGADNWKSEGKLEKICKERGYVIYGEKSNEKHQLKPYEAEHLHEDDEILFFLKGSGLCDVRDTQERWITPYEAEHLHEDDEILFFLKGSGLCDVRDTQERWITVEVNKGILYHFAAGLYHRFFLQSDCDRVSVRAKEKTDPNEKGLKFIVRDDKTDDMLCRKQYLEQRITGNFP